ncbi:MAG: metal-dependent hydrolase [Anaerolineae bacterium]|nr:metal-dependent hydrolase [Anaerolineae bacterium]
MKGIAHFITGVALATCFPEVVRAAAQGSLLPVLGGIAGILPDTLDFKFSRYFERYDLEIDPGPHPDPHAIAMQIAGAMQNAYRSGRPQHVMLHTVRMGANLWRQYTIRFDPLQSEVAVRIGPLVTTEQVPFADTAPPAAHARVKTGVPMVHTYDEETNVDIFSGPSFKFERRGDRLYIHFLDWHRRWSHSLTLAAALGLLGSLLFGRWGGLVIGLGFAAHILEDQLGFMGSNLFYPFTRYRTGGLKLLHSGDAVPNFLTVWTSAMLIILNLDRFSAQPRLDPWLFTALAVLPLAVMGGVYLWRRRRKRTDRAESLRQGEILSEAREPDPG